MVPNIAKGLLVMAVTFWGGGAVLGGTQWLLYTGQQDARSELFCLSIKSEQREVENAIWEIESLESQREMDTLRLSRLRSELADILKIRDAKGCLQYV